MRSCAIGLYAHGRAYEDDRGGNNITVSGECSGKMHGMWDLSRNAGEVWCSALWEVFVDLVQAHGHETAEPHMLKYVVGGLKLTPSSRTFLQARDGIISAATALHPEDVPLVWKGFAKRGMGKDAQGRSSTSTTSDRRRGEF